MSGDGTWAAFCVKGKNTPPVAVDDPPDADAISYESALEGRRPQTLDVLSNDTDVDGDPPACHQGDAATPRAGSGKGGNASSPIRRPLGATHPVSGMESSRFTYTVSDGRGGTDVGRVRVNVAAGDCGPIHVKLTLLDPSNPIFTMEHSTVVCSTPTGYTGHGGHDEASRSG